VGCDAVRWQGAPTQWADAHQEKQRSQRAVVRLNRLRSVLTRWVKASELKDLRRHEAFAAVVSGQLLNLGYPAVPLWPVPEMTLAPALSRPAWTMRR